MLFANKETSEDYNFLNTLSDNVNDYIEQEEGDCLQFVKRKPNLFGVGANEDQICANLKIGFYEDELRKALEESMRMAQENVLERDITYYTENHQSPSNEILEKRNLTEGSDSFRFEKELFGFNGKN